MPRDKGLPVSLWANPQPFSQGFEGKNDVMSRAASVFLDHRKDDAHRKHMNKVPLVMNAPPTHLIQLLPLVHYDTRSGDSLLGEYIVRGR